MTTIKLNVDSAEQFRELLPSSGLFELTDCDIKIHAPWDAKAHDLDLITRLLEGAINVVDLSTNIEDRMDIEIVIQNVPLKRAKNMI